jgi:hypothetical protein
MRWQRQSDASARPHVVDGESQTPGLETDSPNAAACPLLEKDAGGSLQKNKPRLG